MSLADSDLSVVSGDYSPDLSSNRGVRASTSPWGLFVGAVFLIVKAPTSTSLEHSDLATGNASPPSRVTLEFRIYVDNYVSLPSNSLSSAFTIYLSGSTLIRAASL